MAYDYLKSTGLQGGVAGTAGGSMTVDIANTSGIRLREEIVDQIKLIAPNETPFTFLMDNKKVEEANQFEIQYQEEYPIPAGLIATAAVTAAATTIYVDTTEYALAGMALVNPASREQMLITAVTTATNALTVVRGFGEIPGTAIDAGGSLMLTGILGQEGQPAFQGVMRVPDKKVAYLEEHGWGMSDTEWTELVGWRGGDERSRINTQGLRTFKKQREMRFMFGQKKKYSDATYTLNGSSNRIYSAEGLVSYCHQYNIADLNGSIDWDSFAYAMLGIQEFSDGLNFIGMTCQRNLIHLTNLEGFRESIRRNPTESTMGFDLRRVDVSGGGSVTLVAHPMMGDPGVDRDILIFRMEDLELHALQAWKGTQNVQTPGAHLSAWEVKCIEGLVHRNPRGAGVLKNIR